MICPSAERCDCSRDLCEYPEEEWRSAEEIRRYEREQGHVNREDYYEEYW